MELIRGDQQPYRMTTQRTKMLSRDTWSPKFSKSQSIRLTKRSDIRTGQRRRLKDTHNWYGAWNIVDMFIHRNSSSLRTINLDTTWFSAKGSRRWTLRRLNRCWTIGNFLTCHQHRNVIIADGTWMRPMHSRCHWFELRVSCFSSSRYEVYRRVIDL